MPSYVRAGIRKCARIRALSPNVILDDWRFSGFVDLDCAGVGDRHVDVYWALWTLWFNLHTDAYGDRLLDAYGRDLIDMETLRLVAACEVFG